MENFDLKKYLAEGKLLKDEEDSIEEALPKFKGVPPMKDIVKALKDDAKATDSEIKQFMASVKKAGDEFDDVDDYVEDFKNYVAEGKLKENKDTLSQLIMLLSNAIPLADDLMEDENVGEMYDFTELSQQLENFVDDLKEIK